MSKIDVLKLAEFFEKSSIARMEYKVEDEKLVLEKAEAFAPKAPSFMPMPVPSAMPAQAPVAVSDSSVSAPDTSNSNTTKVRAPLVGVFYASPAPGEKPFVSVGESVSKGQVLCLLEAMKMMNEVVSPIDGVIKNIACANEAVVAFDDLLFEVE